MLHLRLTAILAFILSCTAAQAQLRVVVSAERSTFLLYESLPISVQLTNISDEPIVLDNSAGKPWLSFIIKGADRRKIRAESSIETEPMILKPGSSRIVTIDITPHYAIRESGQYVIQASVELPGRRSFLTDGLVFNVGRGEVTWTKSFITGGSQRVVSLIRFIDMKESTLYLRVEEPKENLVYSTIRLGKLIAYTTPEVKFDGFQNIHVIHPVGARLYRYTQADANGQVVRQEDRQAEGSVPTLLVRDDGRIEFAGGKKMTPDLERSKLSDLQQGL